MKINFVLLAIAVALSNVIDGIDQNVKKGGGGWGFQGFRNPPVIWTDNCIV